MTRPDGTFVVSDLFPGTYSLRAYRNGAGGAIVEHVKTGSTLRVQIKPTGSIDGIVTRSSGKLDDTLEVILVETQSGERRREMFYRTEGKFAIRDLPAGTYRMILESEHTGQKTEFVLAEGERKNLSVVLDELVTLTGRIVDMQTKNPIAGVEVSAGHVVDTRVLEGFRHQAMSDATGKFSLPRVPNGVVELRAYSMVDTHISLRVPRKILGSGTIHLGDIPLVRNRVTTEQAGAHGVEFIDQPRTQPDLWRLEVEKIDPNGAAASTDLRVGDVVTAIDGVDVTGSNQAYAWSLLYAPRGTKISLELARGISVVVTLR